MPINKADYYASIAEGTEGCFGRLTEVKISRIDGEPISKGEGQSLKEALSESLPIDAYRLTAVTCPEEDDEVLHVFVGVQKDERMKRNGNHVRFPISAQEIERALKNGWSIL